MSFRVQRIEIDHPLYPASCELRDRVLLAPIGYSMDKFKADYPAVDTVSDHFVAVMDHPVGGMSKIGSSVSGPAGERVVGVVVLVPPEGLKNGQPGVGKLMQMAVEPQLQGSGIGRKLVALLEAHAYGQRGYDRLFCHARIDAAPFYSRLGWEIVGDIFEEAGIDHYRMEHEPQSST